VTSKDDTCPACGGEGTYPIHGMLGDHLFDIECPACDGFSWSDEARERHAQENYDRLRYEAAMRAMRERSAPA